MHVNAIRRCTYISVHTATGLYPSVTRTSCFSSLTQRLSSHESPGRWALVEEFWAVADKDPTQTSVRQKLRRLLPPGTALRGSQ